MDRLDQAVAQGIISPAQRDAIRALSESDDGFRLSLVHVLWTGGAALIGFALWLLAIQIASINPNWLIWTCLVYAAALWALDGLVVRHRSMRLLSALLVMAGGLCVSFAVIAWQGTVGWPTYWWPWDRVPYWSADAPIHYTPLVHGPYLPLVPVVVVASLLLHLRRFLPAGFVLSAAFFIAVMDVVVGLRADATSRDLMAIAAILFAGGWVADLRFRDNHGFWLNKAAVLLFPFVVLLAAVEGITPHLLLWSLAGVALSLFIRRPAGIWASATGIAVWLADWFDAWVNGSGG